MKKVRFRLPSEVVIKDTILNLRKRIRLTKDVSLDMFYRFKQYPCRVESNLYGKSISLSEPLRSQGVLPGDILVVLPSCNDVE